ncbi:MAG: sigma-70 family RNA polymerase sigma factor [Armatimonadota bacterium]|nr:sigma-70 family RNA polymerase sigma factor [bacterium]
MDFDRLVDDYEKPIYNLIYRLVGDSEEAADLTQETFVSAYRSYSEFRGESSAYTWLYRIALNKCKNKFKERDRCRKFETLSLDNGFGTDDGQIGGEVASWEYSPHIAIERKELKEHIARAMSELPYDYRIVAVLRDIEGLSYQDIADAADLSVDVVRTRLARARAMLRKKLGAYLDAGNSSSA